ncbi:chorismate mutase [Rhodopila sp.]|uniref:chorismate mutase n=1 Tax=Rhodopila sp. TaxID=2480087 RepID=UPI003D0E9941
MAHPAATADASTAPSLDEETPLGDGWRPADGGPRAGLSGLRAELDQIDDAVHDLLMRRAQVVEQVARTGKPAAFRPGREASIVRRLVKRHQGSLPAASLFRIWRELLAGTTSIQGGFSLAICGSDPGAGLTQLAREHFGALTPLRLHDNAAATLSAVGDGAASVAVLPFPSDINTWWVLLLHHEPRLHIVARLPFWRDRPDGAPQLQALVIAAAPPDASAKDCSFIGLECDSDISRPRLADELTAAGLACDTMVLLREQGAATAHVLAEVDGYVTDDDPRLSHLGAALRRPVVIGSYAVPFPEAT